MGENLLQDPNLLVQNFVMKIVLVTPQPQRIIPNVME